MAFPSHTPHIPLLLFGLSETGDDDDDDHHHHDEHDDDVYTVPVCVRARARTGNRERLCVNQG